MRRGSILLLSVVLLCAGPFAASALAAPPEPPAISPAAVQPATNAPPSLTVISAETHDAEMNSRETCQHSVVLDESFWWPDRFGWRGSQLDLYVNDTLVLSGMTLPTYTDEVAYYFDASDGDTITTVFRGSGVPSFQRYNQYRIYDGVGGLIAREGGGWTGAPPEGLTVTANCTVGSTGACCYDNGGCEMVESAEDCIDGQFLGLGHTCLECEHMLERPADAVSEDEDCYEGLNEGCQPAEEGGFTLLNCNDTFYGTYGYDGHGLSDFDYDWYSVETTETSVLSLTIESEWVVYFGIYSKGLGGDCSNWNVAPHVVGSAGAYEPVTISTECLPPGEYLIYVSLFYESRTFSGPCPIYYVGTLECTPGCEPALGACCAGEFLENCVSDITEPWCTGLGGEWQGEGSNCDDNPCSPQYCEAWDDFCGDDETVWGPYISRVQLGTLDNSSSWEDGCYSDYTEPNEGAATDLFVGETQEMLVTDGLPSGPNADGWECFYEDVCAVWIDWNQDADFDDDGELVGFVCGGGLLPFSIMVTPPVDAVTGETGMRIRLWFTWDGDNDNPTPCGGANAGGDDLAQGEVEDYTVNIVAVAGACCRMDDMQECIIATPAECEAIPGVYLGPYTTCSGNDCNENGYDDACDIAGCYGTASEDCNLNGIPDECEELIDCNNNGVMDECDIIAGTSADCDGNGIPDECDIADCPAGDLSCADCNLNGVLDGCEVAAKDRGHAYQHDDGEAELNVGLGAGDTVAWLNHFTVDANATRIRYVHLAYASVAEGTPVTVYLWNDPDQDGYPGDAQVIASAHTVVTNPGTNTFDVVAIPYTDIGPAGTHFFVGAVLTQAADEHPVPVDHTASAGQSWIAGGTVFDPNFLERAQLPVSRLDDLGYPGNCLIRAEAQGGDCNGNGIPDDCDIMDGTSRDCNGDMIPDECQLDGNDCNGNGLLDECDILSGYSEDCNENGQPDECDVSDGTSEDCQPDGIPDECQLWTDGRNAGLAGTETLAWDDGSAETALGLTTGGEMVWVQEFIAEEPATVQAVQTCFGAAFNPGGSGVSAGDSFRVFIWSDPNQDSYPFDAVLLAEATGTVDAASIDTDVLQTLPISAQVDGRFFVGASVVHAAGMHPAPVDRDDPHGHAWVTSNELPYNPNYWTDQTYTLEGVGRPGNLLLRVEIEYDTPSNDCNLNGIPDECDLCGDLDLDGDVDYDDYVIFLSTFGGETDGTPPQDWCCDYDHSGAVGMADYAAWLDCYRAYIGKLEAPPPAGPLAPPPDLLRRKAEGLVTQQSPTNAPVPSETPAP
ncbi:MAG: GEVED domain-containing protein [Phycisphaerae bacterium]|jgi:hypothetical protein